MTSDLYQLLGFEYLNDADMERALEADRKWRAKQEARQAKNYGRIIRKILDNVGIQRFMSWF